MDQHNWVKAKVVSCLEPYGFDFQVLGHARIPFSVVNNKCPLFDGFVPIMMVRVSDRGRYKFLKKCLPLEFLSPKNFHQIRGVSLFSLVIFIHSLLFHLPLTFQRPVGLGFDSYWPESGRYLEIPSILFQYEILSGMKCLSLKCFICSFQILMKW